jgi:hypothetical protein
VNVVVLGLPKRITAVWKKITKFAKKEGGGDIRCPYCIVPEGSEGGEVFAV